MTVAEVAALALAGAYVAALAVVVGLCRAAARGDRAPTVTDADIAWLGRQPQPVATPPPYECPWCGRLVRTPTSDDHDFDLHQTAA